MKQPRNFDKKTVKRSRTSKAGSHDPRQAASTHASTDSALPVEQSFQPPTIEQTELFDRLRMQWQFGAWESIVGIDWQAVEQHPQRAQLALLTGTAHYQLGHAEIARRHVTQALEWGCNRRQAAQILISSVHNTLARAAALRHEEARALNHFRNSVHGVNGDAHLAYQARSVREVANLNLIGQAAQIIRSQIQTDLGPILEDFSQEHHKKSYPIQALSKPTHVDTSRLGRPHSTPAADKRTIVIAGMRHSGSTALFNIVRLALKQKGLPFTSFYSEGNNSELLNDPNQGLLLIKTHELRDDVLMRADVVITTRRDLRDTVASAKRRDFPVLRQLNGVVEYAKYNRALHDQWLPHSDHEFVYESFMASPTVEARRVLALLDLADVDVAAICTEVSSLPTDQYDTTLLSPTHVTDPCRVASFRDSLSDVQILKMTSDHAAWLRRYGYDTARDDG